MGEVGELCEIFQWRGCVEDMSGLKSNEITHLGEEIADVFIYNARLADLCGIDLVQAVCQHIKRRSAKNENVSSAEALSLTDTDTDTTASKSRQTILSFEDYTRSVTTCNSSDSENSQLPPRHIVLTISATVGSLCKLVLSRSENECHRGLPTWSSVDKHTLSTGLADVAWHLVSLATMADLNIGECVRDKFAKNSAKYPAHLVKGSSAKYTAYTQVLKEKDQKEAAEEAAAAKMSTTNTVSAYRTVAMSHLFLRVASFSIIAIALVGKQFFR